jgi:hypothetical protein
MAPESLIRQAAADAGLGSQIEVFALQGRGNRAIRKITIAYLFEGGCVFAHHEKETIHAVKWKDIARFRQNITKKYVNGSYRNTTYDFDFTASGGSMFNLIGVSTPPDRLCGLEGLADLAAPLITAAQLPQFRDALKQGQQVEFGWFVVEPTGIRRGRKLLRWPEVEEVKVSEGIITVRQRGKRFRWSRILVSGVPNLGAFLALTRSSVEDWRR